MRSPWLDIPLADFEGHMSSPGVAQAAMLAEQLAESLAAHTPRSVAIIGCAGGNGFDRISAEDTDRIVAIDINPHYLEAVSQRYAARLPGLELHAADIQQPDSSIAPVDLIYAALVFEYVELAPSLRTLRSLCRPAGVLSVLLQLASDSIAAISPSPFPSLRTLAPAMRLVSPDELEAAAAQSGFTPLSSRRIALPTHKAFAALEFRRH